MKYILDKIDHAILNILQRDATLTTDALSDQVHLSRNACWRRVKAMEDAGIIRGKVVLVDPAKVGCGLTIMVLIGTNDHSDSWLEQFQSTLRTLPEVVGAYRMTGDLDYVLKVRVADVAAYDTFYKRLTSRVRVSDISASFVMEEIKDTTAVPL